MWLLLCCHGLASTALRHSPGQSLASHWGLWLSSLWLPVSLLLSTQGRWQAGDLTSVFTCHQRLLFRSLALAQEPPSVGMTRAPWLMLSSVYFFP